MTRLAAERWDGRVIGFCECCGRRTLLHPLDESGVCDECVSDGEEVIS